VIPANPTFLGSTYDATVDRKPLTTQLAKVWNVVRDGRWYTLSYIAAVTHAPEASLSARLRDLRRYGMDVERLREPGSRQYSYRVSNARQFAEQLKLSLGGAE
jgi:hypothetical protein